MKIDLTSPIFHDEDKAREHLEAQRWPNGPFCPHCGEAENVHRLQGKSHRPGLFQCNACSQAFTVMVGSIFERSHIPLAKWVLAFHLMAASKKGVSSLQLSRMLGITYKSAWFMSMRIREAMTDPTRGPIGGEGKILEADETVIGGKKRNRAYAKVEPKKHAVMTLIERGGGARSFHIANVTAKLLRPLIVMSASRRSSLMTDDAKWYQRVGEEFASHHAVNHAQNEYVRPDVVFQSGAIKINLAHTNTAECFFSLCKRAVFGAHHSVSEAHLKRYVAEWDFKFNTRKMTDGERAAMAMAGAAGKRLTYRQPRKAAIN
jgi:transposase-like protein